MCLVTEMKVNIRKKTKTAKQIVFAQPEPATGSIPIFTSPGSSLKLPETRKEVGIKHNSVILLLDSVTKHDTPYPTPEIVGHYIQEVPVNAPWVHHKPVVIHEVREPGVHLSGIIKLMTRRTGSFAIDEVLPERVVLGQAFESRWMGYEWHNGTFYQPGPINLEGVHMTPDGITPLPDSYLETIYPGIWRNRQPFLIEELKLTYYSSKRSATLITSIEFQGWMHQIAGYILGVCVACNSYDYCGIRTNSSRKILSRLTVCWVNDNYSYGRDAENVWVSKTPKYEVWIMEWDIDIILNWWKTTVMKFRDHATPEKGS